MKRILVLCFFFIVAMAAPVRGQNQFALLIKRIALLQVYLEYLQKGYSIARNGWQTVRNITKGEFDLHAQYFQSLEKVNPAIKRFGNGLSLLQTEIRMVRAVESLGKYARNCEQFSEAEIQYIKTVLDGLLGQVEKDVELFTLVISDGKVKMGDSDRVGWMERLEKELTRRNDFLQQVFATVHGLARSREAEGVETRTMRRFYLP